MSVDPDHADHPVEPVEPVERVEPVEPAPTSTPAETARRIPRSCSDVYRLWAAVGLGTVLLLVFYVAQDTYQELGLRKVLTPAQQALEEDYGANLVAWVGFAVCYLWLGIRAFSGTDHAELTRRLLGSPLPSSTWLRWLLAGGGSLGWPVLIAVWAFSTVITAVINKQDVPVLVIVMAGLTVLSCIALITFSFAIHYARKDAEDGGLEFAGPDRSVFSDYVYLAAGCSVTFGTTDTTVSSASMRRVVTFHSVLGWVLNTVVIAVLLSLVTS